MKIGIDIDDTLASTSEILMDIIKKDKTVDWNNPLNNIKDILRGNVQTEDAQKFFKSLKSDLADKVLIKDGAKEAIDKLVEAGHKIYIITARDESLIPNAFEISEKFLKDNEIKFEELYVGIYNKASFCFAHQIDVMIDDSLEICEDMVETSTKPLLFTSIVNQDFETDVERVNSWKEIENILL